VATLACCDQVFGAKLPPGDEPGLSDAVEPSEVIEWMHTSPFLRM
jgi:hypothetical protein